jgi:hypothetical protein
MSGMTYVQHPKTSPPDANKPYVCFAGPDGKEQWIEMASDAADGVTDADFDFAAGKAHYANEDGQ